MTTTKKTTTTGWLLLLLGSTLTPALARPAPVDPICEKLFPAAEVERVGGLKGVKSIGRDYSISAGGTCNWALDGKKVVLMAMVEEGASAKMVDGYKKGSLPGQSAALPGLGDEAFTNAKGTAVLARKGRLLLVLSTFFDVRSKDMRGYFSRDQLVGLARSAFDRAK